MTHASTVTTDVCCLSCGYNLRTLAMDARCPECGTEMLEALYGGIPVTDTLGRRRRLAWACGMLALAMALFLVILFVPERGPAPGEPVWAWNPARQYVPLGVVTPVAMGLFALPQTRRDGRPLFRAKRWAIGAAAVTAPAALGMWELAYGWLPARSFEVTSRLVFLPLFMVAPGVMLCFRLLAQLARPLGLPRLRGPLRVAEAGWGLITVVVTVGLMVMIQMPMPWYVVDRLFGPVKGVAMVAAWAGAVGTYAIGLVLLVVTAVALGRSRPRELPGVESLAADEGVGPSATAKAGAESAGT